MIIDELGASRCRPATSSATTGARQPPTSPARATMSASRIPAIDALIDRVIFAKDRDELVAATKALDRVLLWNHYVVPQWTYGKVRTARWDRFGHPDTLPKYGRVRFPDDLVVGRGQGRQDGIAPVTRAPAASASGIAADRREALALGAGALALCRRAGTVLRARAGGGRAPRHLGLRRPQISAPTSSISITSIRTRRRAACSRRSVADAAVQPELPHLQLAQQLHPQGRRRPGHGADLRDPDGRVAPPTSPTRMYGLGGARGAHLRRRPDLSLPAAAGGAASTTARRSPPHDVAFSLDAPEGEGPSRSSRSCCATSSAPRRPTTPTVVVRFAPRRARDVPLFVAQLPIFSRAYYAGRPFDESTLDVPLGSGPYKVGRFEAGRFIEYERVKDWWGADLPVARGQNNFDIVRYEYYRDRDVGLRGLHRQELSVPRGVHLAHLGDALRLSRRSRTAASSATCCPTRRRPARRAGSSTRGARSSRTRALREALELRLRFRMDQQEHHVRLLRAHPSRCSRTPT